MKAKDWTVQLGAAVGAVAQTGVAMRDVERSMKEFRKAIRDMPREPFQKAAELCKLLKKNGWMRDEPNMGWHSPDDTTFILDQAMAASPETAEEVYLGWLREKNDWQPQQAHVNSRCTVANEFRLGAVSRVLFPQFEEPVSSVATQYITNEPDDPLKWLDAQVEAVCKAGRL